MIITKWSAYVPIYPNSQIPYNRQTSPNRVVEPSTRSSVNIDVGDTWAQRVEKLRESHRNAAILRYDRNGRRKIPPIEIGSVFDFEV